MAKSPNKKEIARMKALADIGESNRSIAERTGRTKETVKKYLQRTELYDDPEIQGMIATIKRREISDLYLLGAKARNRLHDILDEGKTKAIETTAVMDRSFQQRRLLEGESTANISTREAIMMSMEIVRNAKAELAALEAEK